jgi:hypothetical protein
MILLIEWCRDPAGGRKRIENELPEDSAGVKGLFFQPISLWL